jgi:hypothetical protein
MSRENKNEKFITDCGGIKPEPILPPVDEDGNILTPADYDRWDGRTGIKVIKPAPKE